MKPPPDEKSVEVLSAATTGRKARGKWRFAAVAVAALALLVVGFFAALEGHRQADIAEANEEAGAEAAKINAYFEHVTDWKKWYRDRQPANWGGEEFAAWVERSQPAVERNAHSPVEVVAEGRLRGEPNSDPDYAAARHLLDDTADIAVGARELVKFDALAPLPKLDSGMPSFAVLPTLGALFTLRARIGALFLLEEWDQAWEECSVMLDVAQRLKYSSSAVSALVQSSAENYAHEWIQLGLSDRPAPRRFLEAWSKQPSYPAGHFRPLLEAELAYVAQYSRMADRVGWTLGTSDLAEEPPAWFSYMGADLNWRERKMEYFHPAESARMAAQHYREIREAWEQLERGEQADYQFQLFDWYWIRVRAMGGRMDAMRQTTELVCRLRLLELEERDVAARSGRATELMSLYPQFELSITPEIWRLELRFNDAVRDALEWEDADLEDFRDGYRPVFIKPIKN